MAWVEHKDYEIVLRDPESVLRRCLGSEIRVVDFESDDFVKTGDNYGSTIKKVRVKLSRDDGDGKDHPEVLDLVAKMLPPTDFQREMFDSGFTFKKEIFLYETLIPVYRSLLPDFDAVPRFYGARVSREPGTKEIDEDAVIFLENLKAKGYYMVDRHKGLDTSHLKLAIRALARFHAVGLSIKHRKPDFLPILKQYGTPLAVKDDVMSTYVNSFMEQLRADDQGAPYVDRVLATKTRQLSESYYSPLAAEHEWACTCHGDNWVNNLMFHRDDRGVDDVKMVDFQTFYLSSPLTDLVFLLCSSMELPIVGFDEALELYRRSAADALGELHCDASLFSGESFHGRLKIDAANELFHVMLMTKVVELGDGENFEKSGLNEACLRRARRILDIYANKGWI
ncbi:uncharacterized protein LOC106639918 [Copidosoma floridanum]|uniref:uncharacterized protein LOC106639918 n=1 Tax=Copidosoma floridanum TaxID=29053 RepID=UPI0006C99690|nr:uncharacterized protein LOC106639918 [Copidosoma floridanum]